MPPEAADRKKDKAIQNQTETEKEIRDGHHQSTYSAAKNKDKERMRGEEEIAKRKTVTTQEELNRVPVNFNMTVEVAFGNEKTPAIIDRPSDRAVFVIRGKTVAIAKGKSEVHAFEQSKITAGDQSKGLIHDRSVGLFYNHSKGVGYHQSKGTFMHYSKGEAFDQSRVIVFDETVQVKRFDDSTIEYVK